jgi:ubiquinone/menaquinone biosynthesis C-methylase UbiE
MVADATRLPFASGSFSSINLANALHCIVNPVACLREAHRVLESDGRLAVNVLTEPRGPFRKIAEAVNQWGQRKGILVAPMRAEHVRAELQAAGFAILEESQHGNSWACLATKVH